MTDLCHHALDGKSSPRVDGLYRQGDICISVDADVKVAEWSPCSDDTQRASAHSESFVPTLANPVSSGTL